MFNKNIEQLILNEIVEYYNNIVNDENTIKTISKLLLLIFSTSPEIKIS